MGIIYDPAKREAILRERGLDIADADEIFDGFHATRADEKHSLIEQRLISAGMMSGQLIIVVWTWREEDRRIVTMWKANDKERDIYKRERDRYG